MSTIESFSVAICVPWIDRQGEHIYFSKRDIEAVRANLLMKWLHDNLQVVPQINLFAILVSW